MILESAERAAYSVRIWTFWIYCFVRLLLADLMNCEFMQIDNTVIPKSLFTSNRFDLSLTLIGSISNLMLLFVDADVNANIEKLFCAVFCFLFLSVIS
jgi:uncharacterized membrane protein